MSLQEIDLAKELDGVESELLEARQQDEGIHRRIAELEAAATGIRYLMRKRKIEPTDQIQFPWAEMHRTRAIERALREAGRPMPLATILKTLRDHGRKEKSNDVSQGLYRLKVQGKARSLGNGAGWVLLDKTNDSPERPETPASDASTWG